MAARKTATVHENVSNHMSAFSLVFIFPNHTLRELQHMQLLPAGGRRFTSVTAAQSVSALYVFVVLFSLCLFVQLQLWCFNYPDNHS